MADVQFMAIGHTIKDLFFSSADALNDTIRGDIVILEQKEKLFNVSGKDLEELLHNFLEEFLYLLEAENFLVSKITNFDFDEIKKTIKVIVVGDDVKNYVFTNDVKAITYSEMFVRKECDKWICQVVLDV
jgi:SHS2 domain-containing protein